MGRSGRMRAVGDLQPLRSLEHGAVDPFKYKFIPKIIKPTIKTKF